MCDRALRRRDLGAARPPVEGPDLLVVEHDAGDRHPLRERDLERGAPQGAFRLDCFPVSSSIATRHTLVRASVEGSNSHSRPE